MPVEGLYRIDEAALNAPPKAARMQAQIREQLQAKATGQALSQSLSQVQSQAQSVSDMDFLFPPGDTLKFS